MLRLIALLWVALCSVTAVAQDSYRYDAPARVVAFGDVHGAYDALTRTLRAVDVIDAEQH